eukprot:TRINITY_DN15148_c0_g1_i1.p1 TRINITY_DN15148_c0_g1~~TRINITY_DN15148_c0_g1_i1.p1  ORF type:complete len:369 (-),score=51.39 TRINITY_DN15148_c0_g1_i1:343-1449(-)
MTQSSPRSPGQGTSEFQAAVQDLRSLRPLLRDAADYAESAYLRSERQDVEMANVREYSTSMLAILLERLGSAADKLEGVVEQEATQVEGTALLVTSVTERVAACYEYIGRDGLNRLVVRRGVPRQHSGSSDTQDEAFTRKPVDANEDPWFIRETFDMAPITPPYSPRRDETAFMETPSLWETTALRNAQPPYRVGDATSPGARSPRKLPKLFALTSFDNRASPPASPSRLGLLMPFSPGSGTRRSAQNSPRGDGVISSRQSIWSTGRPPLGRHRSSTEHRISAALEAMGNEDSSLSGPPAGKAPDSPSIRKMASGRPSSNSAGAGTGDESSGEGEGDGNDDASVPSWPQRRHLMGRLLARKKPTSVRK